MWTDQIYNSIYANTFLDDQPCQCWVKKQCLKDPHQQGRCGEWPYIGDIYTHTPVKLMPLPISVLGRRRTESNCVPTHLTLTYHNIDSNEFWQWCTVLRITRFLGFAHHLVFLKLENTMFLRDPNEQVSSPPHLRMEKNPVSETLCFLVSRILDDGQSPKT
jgi:hypothetical protein